MRRVYKTAISRDAEFNVVSTRGPEIRVLEFYETKSIVKTAPGNEEMYEAILISPNDLNTDELLRVEHIPGAPSDDIVFRVLTVDASRIGRNSYRLTRKLKDAG